MSEENFSPEFGTPYQALIDHCESNKLRFTTNAERKAVMFSMCRDAAVFNCLLQITHDDEVFQIHIDYPVQAKDAKMRPLAAEFVARANHRMVIGNFDLDMSDGEVRFHAGHIIGAHGLEDESIGCLVATALGTADRYFPAYMRMMYGGHTPEDAVFMSELDFHGESDASVDEPAAPAELPTTPAIPKPSSKKKRRRPRKDSRSKTTKELPGLFDREKNPDEGSS